MVGGPDERPVRQCLRGARVASGRVARDGTAAAVESDDHGRAAVHRTRDARRRALSDLVPAVVPVGRQGHRPRIRPSLHTRRLVHVSFFATPQGFLGRFRSRRARVPAVRNHHFVRASRSRWEAVCLDDAPAGVSGATRSAARSTRMGLSAPRRGRGALSPESARADDVLSAHRDRPVGAVSDVR